MASNKNQNDAFNDIPPGKKLLSFFDNFPLGREVATHLGLLHIIDDHQIMWFEAGSRDHKVGIHKRFRLQVLRGLVSFGGFELAVHGTVSTVTGQLPLGASLMLLGAAILYLTRR